MLHLSLKMISSVTQTARLALDALWEAITKEWENEGRNWDDIS